MFKLTWLYTLCTFAFFSASAQTERFYDKIFTVETTSDIPFGSNVEFDGDSLNLKLDIYQPQGDTLSERPLIILSFGGSFTFGTKISPDITQLCNEFAARGYVTCAIEYRLGFENGNDSDTNQLKALFRGIQDLQAALRYFYKDRQTANAFRIDTQQIFIGGVSAGAFMSLNHAFYKETVFTNPPPVWVQDALDEIHWFDGNSGNPGYSTKVKGVINLCGGLADTIWLQPGDPVVLSIHGTDDDLVPYKFDSAQAAVSVEARLFGSLDVHQRATHIGLTSELKLFSDAGHAPFIFPKSLSSAAIAAVPLYMDTTIWTIRDFLYANIERKDLPSGVHAVESELQMQVYPNPATHQIAVRFENIKEQPLQITLFDLLGKQRLSLNGITASTITINKDDVGNGMFFLQVRNLNTKKILGNQSILFLE